MMRMSIAVAVAALALPFRAIGQAAPAFEVASIKPSDGHLGIEMKTFPNRLSATACSLRQLIQAAYSAERMTGGPAWLDTDRFDIEAKTTEDLSGETDRVKALGRPAPRKMMLMLQTLLAERFNVKVHLETRQDNVYELVVAKNTRNLQPPQETTRSFIGVSRGGFDRIEDFNPATALEIITGHNASMGQLAEFLAGSMGRPVTDQTGIKGNYDFRFQFVPENSPGSTLLSALQDAIGLKLNTSKGPVEFLVVDHADKPSAN